MESTSVFWEWTQKKSCGKQAYLQTSKKNHFIDLRNNQAFIHPWLPQKASDPPKEL